MRITSSFGVALAVGVLVGACDRPSVLVICHNSNCAEPTDPENDDTIEALTESLAVEVNGKPVIDGTEIDLFWRASDDTCLFAHDLASGRTELASEAANAVANHLLKPGDITSHGAPFSIFIELKPFVDLGESVRHTPDQLVRHAECAWVAYTTIADAALSSGREIDVYFASFGPELLHAMIAARPASVPFEPRYEAFYGVPHPLDNATVPLDKYAGLPITLVEMHPQWIIDAQYEGLLSSNIEIGFFMFSATVETFAAIEQYEPAIVNTSEATLMRRWLEN